MHLGSVLDSLLIDVNHSKVGGHPDILNSPTRDKMLSIMYNVTICTVVRHILTVVSGTV